MDCGRWRLVSRRTATQAVHIAGGAAANVCVTGTCDLGLGRPLHTQSVLSRHISSMSAVGP